MPRAELIQQSHATREAWLAAAAELLAPMFARAGYPLPPSIKFGLGFTSKGTAGKDKLLGECWHQDYQEGHAHIFISHFMDDPNQILGVLVHELCHAAAPANSKHGPAFVKIADAIGCEGKAKHKLPGADLQAVLETHQYYLGPLPHSPLRLTRKTPKPPKPIIKCVCLDCGYEATVKPKLLETQGAPICPCQVDEFASDEGIARMEIVTSGPGEEG
jgi:hypothetical protein